MSDTNDITIESYNAHIQEYIDGTTKEISAVVRNWLDKSLFGLSKKARILELGSAFGRDASYITELGYTVECSDATSAFVDLLNASGFNARILNVITDNLPLGLDLVVAHAVLLHFTRTETHQVIKKVFNALNANGTFAFTLKKGEGEEWSNVKLGAPRYFCYWSLSQIKIALIEAGFKDIQIDNKKEISGVSWLLIIAKKR